MSYSVKVINHKQSYMLNICDAELVGKNIQENELKMNIKKNYYGDRIVDGFEAKALLQNSSIINMVGEQIIALSISLGIGSKNGVKRIDGIPFLIVFST